MTVNRGVPIGVSAQRRLHWGPIAMSFSLSPISMPKLLASLLLTLFAIPAFAADKPNVVFVITDDQGYGDLSCHGNPVLKTPNLDALYAQSTRLTDYHVSPTCSPTRSALMSGHYTNRSGAWHTIMGRSFLFEGEMTLGDAFAAGGYATGMFGKWHLGDNYPFRPEDRGFQQVVRHGGGGIGQTPDVWNNAYFDDSYFVNSKIEPRKGYCTDVFFDEARQFIKQQADAGKPFFAYISTNAPHGPFHCPEKYTEPYKDQKERVAVFFGMIANIDENVGKLRNWLAEEGLAEETIFVFTTDNGTASGAKVWNARMSGSKGSSMDGGHRVPMFIHWPAGGMDQPVNVNQLTAHIDMLPTFQELCGLPPVDPSYKLDGKSIVPLLKDPHAEWEDRTIITDSQRILHPKKWKSSATMRGRWRLVGGKKLFDIKADPGQKEDVKDQYPEVYAKLRADYQAWWKSLQPALKRQARIVLGHPAENPATLTCHDWLTDGKHSPWNQQAIRQGQDRIGTWSVHVDQPGKYRITLRRWPAEAATPLAAGLDPAPGVPGLLAYRQAPGKALAIETAGIELGSVKLQKPVDPQSTSIVFETELSEGPASLLGYFKLSSGKKIGSYFAEVLRVDQ